MKNSLRDDDAEESPVITTKDTKVWEIMSYSQLRALRVLRGGTQPYLWRPLYEMLVTHGPKALSEHKKGTRT